MRLAFILSLLTISLSLLSAEAEIIDRTDHIAQAHQLAGHDLDTFNLIAACRYHGTSCHAPQVTQTITAVIHPDFKTQTASLLQNAVFELLKPIIETYKQAIAPAMHPSLTPTQKILFLDLAQCLFFKLNCDIKANFMLTKTSDSGDTLRSIPPSLRIELEHAYTNALEAGMIMGAPPVDALETYQDSDFLALSHKFALNPADTDLFLRFIRFIKEQSHDPSAEEIYVKTMELTTKLLNLKKCIFNPECFKKTTSVDFTSEVNAVRQYEYNVRLTLNDTPSIIKAAYEYWQIYSNQKNYDPKRSQDALAQAFPKLADPAASSELDRRLAALTPAPKSQPLKLSELERRLAALQTNLPTKSVTASTDTTALTPSPLIPSSKTILEPDAPETKTAVIPNPLPASNPNNVTELEQALLQAGHTYNTLITTDFTNKQRLLTGEPLPVKTSTHPEPSPTTVSPKATLEPINRDNLVDVEKFLINNLGQTYTELLNANLSTKQAMLSPKS